MMKKLVLLLAFLAFAVNAGAAAITINSPMDGQTFNIGEAMIFDYNVDVNIVVTGAYLISSGIANALYQVRINDNVTRRYRTSVDTTAFSPGTYWLRVYVTYRLTPEAALEVLAREVQIALLASAEPVDENAAVTVIRILPETIYPGGWVTVGLAINPHESFPGIILTESLPQGFRFSSISTIPLSVQNSKDLEADGRIAKLLLRKNDGIQSMIMSYLVDTPADLLPDTTVEVDGNWLIEGESGITRGAKVMRVSGFRMPDCPLSDEQLLAFVRRWSLAEIDNAQILQVIERWANC